MTKILYGVAGLMVLVLLWQVWAMGQVYAALEDKPANRAMGATAKDAAVTIIAFIDYSTQPSQTINPVVMEAVEAEKDVRLVIHPAPQNNDSARRSALFALAAARQSAEGFTKLHDILMRNQRPMSDEVIRELAAQAGLDADKILTDMDAPETRRDMVVSLAAMQKLGLNATPAFIMNRKGFYIPKERFPTVAEFTDLITRARDY